MWAGRIGWHQNQVHEYPGRQPGQVTVEGNHGGILDTYNDDVMVSVSNIATQLSIPALSCFKSNRAPMTPHKMTAVVWFLLARAALGSSSSDLNKDTVSVITTATVRDNNMIGIIRGDWREREC